MALAYTAPTWVNGSGTGISASQLQALSDCMEGLVQGSDKAITNISISGQTITLTFADGSQESGTASGLKGISSIAKTGTSGNVDTYTITYTDGSTSTFTVTNGTTGPAGPQGPQGEQGPAGDDGVSPEVTITAITGGHRVNITDATHPQGQDFDVMDGHDGASDWDDITNKPNFATVATSGSYNDLSNKPSIPAAQVNSDWNAASGVAQILNKPTIPSITNCYQTTDTEETALANADYVPFYDISASAKRKISWSNIKSVLKSYFDTLYSKVVANPSGTATGTLTKLGIGSEIYEIQGGGGGITKTITVYSAAVDTVTFTDLTGSKTVTTNASGVGTVSINYISGMVITFTSSVAKNPNNLSEDYKKSVQILDTTTEVYVMPNKNVLYWYGYESSNLEDCTNANGWSRTGYTFTAPTRNTNYLAISSTNNNYSMVGTKNAISANTIHIIALGLTIGDGSNTYGLICIPSSITSKTFGSPPYATNSGITQNVIAKYDMDTSSYSAFYIAAGSSFLKTSKLYAFWYDDNDDDLLKDKADKTDIAPVENSTTASRAYAIGQQFYLSDGKLYKCKQSIAQGATFTIGTNCELAPSITDQIKALWDAINS